MLQSLHNGHLNQLPGAAWRLVPLTAHIHEQIKVPAHAWRCNVDQIDGLVVSCTSIPSFAHADNHSRRTRTRTSAAEQGCLSPRASAIWRPSRWGQSAVHLAACAVALWPCAAHGPPLAAHMPITRKNCNIKALNLCFSAVKSSRVRNSKTEVVFDNCYGVACRRSLKFGADRAPGRRSGIRANLEIHPRI